MPRRLDSGRLHARHLDAWTLEPCTLDAWTLDAWTLDTWTQKILSIFSDISLVTISCRIFKYLERSATSVLCFC